MEDVARALGFQVSTGLASTVPSFLKLELEGEALRFDDSSSLTVQLALPPPTSEGGRGFNVPYPAIHWLNDDILLAIFHCYRLDKNNGWNDRLEWRKLSHVCQRWRHLIHEYSSHLGMHIQCTYGNPMVNTLDHFPRLPLFVRYYSTHFFEPSVSMRDELWIYHTLRWNRRIRLIELNLPPSILQEVLVLMLEYFPTLEHLSLSSPLSADSGHHLPLTLPKAFVAPNLRHLTLIGISLPKRLRVLTFTIFLVTLTLSGIQSSYFRPRLLVARLQSLPLLEKLTIEFSIPIPRPSTERDILGEKGAPITLPSLKTLKFSGVGAYLESLVAQIRVPLLEELFITLFNQIALVLPHLFNLINNTKVFKLSTATVSFHRDKVCIRTDLVYRWTHFHLLVKCKSLDWQIDCAAQICHGLIPTLSGVEGLTLTLDRYHGIPTELQNGAIDSATWHDLLRTFLGVKRLEFNDALLEELSRALQVDEVGLDPEFLPNLRCIAAKDNHFASFIDIRQVVGRPVQCVKY